MKTLASILFIAATSGAASANGFLLNEFDARATGRGNATTATESDPSAIYYNVGGLAVEPGTNIMIGGSLIEPVASFTDGSTGIKTDSSTSTQFVPGIFGSSHVTDVIAVGLGFYTPFGLAVDWPTNSPQANVAQNVALHSFFITPSIGANLGSFIPGLSVGAGVDLVPATLELKQQIYVGADGTGCGGANPSCAHLGATAFGVGGRIGVMYQPGWDPRLSFGFMWRSEVQENFDGTANFDAPAEYRQMLPADGKASTVLELPQSFSGGVAFRPQPGLEVELDAIWTQWSKFKELDLAVPPALNDTTGTTTIIVSPQNYQDKTTIRFGGEYKLATLGAAFRAGFIYDPTPVPSTTLTATLPDVDRYDLTLGATKSFGRYALHGGFLWVLPRSRTTKDTPPYMPEYKGTYDVQAFVASVSLSARLDSGQ
jgi:long-chain fatty acid transport protein